jgi:hypothetical protein
MIRKPLSQRDAKYTKTPAREEQQSISNHPQQSSKIRLVLDDCRSLSQFDGFTHIVRSHEQFVQFVTKNHSQIEAISFDYFLGSVMYPNGIDSLNWFVEYSKQNSFFIKELMIHTSDQEKRFEMKRIVREYLSFLRNKGRGLDTHIVKHLS